MVKRQEIMGCESVDMVRFDLGTLLQGQMRIAKIESAYNSLIIGDRDLGWEIIGSESFGMVRFELWTPPSRSNDDSQA